MNLDILKSDSIKQNEIEHVEKQKHELKHLGTFFRTRGLNLYSYSHLTGKIQQVDIKRGNTIYAVVQDGRLIAKDLETEKCLAGVALEYFEALNMKTAQERIKAWKQGKKQLCNLKVPSENGIKYF